MTGKWRWKYFQKQEKEHHMHHIKRLLIKIADLITNENCTLWQFLQIRTLTDLFNDNDFKECDTEYKRDKEFELWQKLLQPKSTIDIRVLFISY